MCCWISRERVRPSVKSKQQKPRRKSRTRAEQRTIRRNFIRKTLSLVILLLCIFPMLGGGMQPMCVIPAALCISMNEDMYFCMAAGVIGGFGNDRTDLLCAGTKKEIQDYVEQIVAEAGTTGVIIGADCTTHLQTPDAHIHWVYEKAAEISERLLQK